MPKFPTAVRQMASTVMRYGLAVLSVIAAWLVTELLQHFTNGPSWFVFLAAVMISSWVGGLGPGVLAVLLSILAIDYFFVPPLHQFSIWANKIAYLPHLVVFGLSALFISWLSDRRKRAEQALTLFRSLIDHTNDAIEVIDPETGRFLDVDEQACRAGHGAGDQPLDHHGAGRQYAAQQTDSRIWAPAP